MIADLLVGALDHAMALAGLLVLDLAAGRDLEPNRFLTFLEPEWVLSLGICSPWGRTPETLETSKTRTATAALTAAVRQRPTPRYGTENAEGKVVALHRIFAMLSIEAHPASAAMAAGQNCASASSRGGERSNQPRLQRQTDAAHAARRALASVVQ